MITSEFARSRARLVGSRRFLIVLLTRTIFAIDDRSDFAILSLHRRCAASSFSKNGIVNSSSQAGSTSVSAQRSASPNGFTKRLEASTAFIPAVYAADGIFLVALPFLFPLECHGAYAQCLSLAFSTRPYNAGFLPIPAGLLLLSAAIARINKDEPPEYSPPACLPCRLPSSACGSQ
jgi:hypothetical protein